MILRITFRYTEVAESKARRYPAASSFTSLRPPMPQVDVQIVLQKMAVDLRSVNLLAAKQLAAIGTYS